MRERQPLIAILGVLLPVMLLLGIFLGGHPGLLPGPLRDAFVDRDVAAVDQGLDVIARDYYRPVGRGELVDRSLSGAVAGLKDRFSHYLDPRAYREFQNATEGEFSGVGLNVAPDPRGLRVVEVFPNSPARRAGIRHGDLVTAVNGRSIAHTPSQVASALIQGKAGTRVTLTVVEHGRPRAERIERARIDVPSVSSNVDRRAGVGLADVRLLDFSQGSGDELAHVVKERLAHGAKGVVLDLRGNGGGLLQEAVRAASVFIPKGPIVITKGRARGRHVYKAEGGAISTRVPVVVLVDGNSASAAEILAGALQDRRRARLVGARTFGKGVFQEIEPLDNGGALDITVGQYFTPSGKNLGAGTRRGAGLEPDVPVRTSAGNRRDRALAVALGLLARDAKRGR